MVFHPDVVLAHFLINTFVLQPFSFKYVPRDCSTRAIRNKKYLLEKYNL